MKIPFLILRIFIGWHFLYEGIIKLVQQDWSSQAYLAGSYGFLSGIYNWMATNPGLIQVVDFLNIWGLILIGSALFLGLFIRLSSAMGILLLSIYYLAYPPFGAAYSGFGLEGHFWIINRNLLEIIALFLVFQFPIEEYSVMKLFFARALGKANDLSELEEEAVRGEDETTLGRRRRDLLKGLVTLPVFGGMMIGSVARARSTDLDVMSGATIALKRADLSELKGELPKGKLGNLEVSRLYMGSNLITGFAHARDLIYTRQLMRQYNTFDKLIETFSLADQAGINMTNMGLPSFNIFNRFKEITGSNMQTCVQTKIDMEGNDRLVYFKEAIDQGASTMYVHGSFGDDLCRNGRMDLIQEAVEFLQSQGFPAGVGGHYIDVINACENHGIRPDYYFKTMHHDRYWSAHPREHRVDFDIATKSDDHNKHHDNMWDVYPEQTVEVLRRVRVPVIGFKVLAAGAITPVDGFRYAFENGADFICVGMFDYQIIEDVNLVTEILSGELNRSRPWYS